MYPILEWTYDHEQLVPYGLNQYGIGSGSIHQPNEYDGYLTYRYHRSIQYHP